MLSLIVNEELRHFSKILDENTVLIAENIGNAMVFKILSKIETKSKDADNEKYTLNSNLLFSKI
jgi:hypothetical protein